MDMKMKRMRVMFLGVLLASFFASCVTIESAADKDFHMKLTRVFITVHSNEDMKDFFRDLESGLRTGFSLHSIDSKLKELNELSLDGPSQVQREIDEYHPDAVLIIGNGVTKQSTSAPHFIGGTGPGGSGGTMIAGNTYTSGGKMEAGLFQPHSDQAIWKATVSTTGFLGMGVGSGSGAAEKMLAQLVNDGLIPKAATGSDTTKPSTQ